MDCLAGYHQSGRAIVPLCHAAMSGRPSDRDHARKVLQRMGRPHRIAMRALRDLNLSDRACAAALLALETIPVYLFPLLFRQFNATNFLAAALRRRAPDLARVESVLARLAEHQTLLRAAEGQQADSLLRPSEGSVRSDSDQLLRASEGEPAEIEAKESWWRKLLSRR